MNFLYLGHLSVFVVSALLCFASIAKAQQIQHRGTREGFVAILLTCGLWAGGYLGYFLLPTAELKVASYIFGLIAALGCVGAWLYFSAAYTGRTPRQAPYRRFIIGGFLFLVLLKITNPLHQLYFTTEWATEPFPHLALQQGILHWVVLAFAYVAIGVSFFMLLERFYSSGASARPLAALVGITALPIVFNILGAMGESLLPIWYEPLGVAIFAVGTLFVYFERFEAIRFVGGSDGPTIFLDQDGTIRDSNQPAIALFPELDGTTGRPIAAVLPALAERLEAEDPDPITRKYGDDTEYYHVATSPILAGEVVTAHVITLSNVTEREHYRRELETMTEQLEALNRLVRHDIRNDMAVIVGWMDTLPGDLDDPVEDVLERVRRKSEHVINLTENASDLVDAVTGEGKVDIEPIALRRQINLELEAVRETYPHAKFEIDGTVPDVRVQANAMLSSVFQNLLNNAIVHNNEKTPKITVSGEVRDDVVRVRIADNGAGIPDSQKDEIFGKGEKGLDSPGTGIGLYLVQTLVNQYGGQVWVEDNEPGGSVFVVELLTAN
ncbi:MAG: histidine kinase N-terminal 7TM domain-containing protein [Halodesulfurarchaeum sp.]|nr:histidine kinase N-terminal 7TM domain-containing protein [Halodesulfurarchaeum sp.]